MTTAKIRVKKTPNGRHLYTATMKGVGTYGWGDTPAEARTKLAEQIERYAAEKSAEISADEQAADEARERFTATGIWVS